MKNEEKNREKNVSRVINKYKIWNAEKKFPSTIPSSTDEITLDSLCTPLPAPITKKRRGKEEEYEKGRENFAQNPIDKQTETKSGGSLKSNNVHSVGGAFSRRELEGRDRAPIGRRSDTF